ncbi:Hpt domain-containing protein [Paenarthrobacter sp. NyZ202]|uniref:Hpt domain-containing protein n=1 Tax=Paenarthrobacter sp. NyZ202 TaxID=3402689 RepID=UPI003CECC15E
MSEFPCDHPAPGTMGPADSPAETPVFEDRRLQHLADELGDAQPVLRLCSMYLSMLPGRISNICSGLDEGDEEATMTAVLSLKVSSAMVGAVETEHQCRELELMIRAHHLDFVAKALPALQSYSERCVAAGPQLLGRAWETLAHGIPLVQGQAANPRPAGGI